MNAFLPNRLSFLYSIDLWLHPIRYIAYCMFLTALHTVLSLRLSVTRRYCVNTAKLTVEILPLLGSSGIILVNLCVKLNKEQNVTRRVCNACLSIQDRLAVQLQYCTHNGRSVTLLDCKTFLVNMYEYCNRARSCAVADKLREASIAGFLWRYERTLRWVLELYPRVSELEHCMLTLRVIVANLASIICCELCPVYCTPSLVTDWPLCVVCLYTKLIGRRHDLLPSCVEA